MPTEDDLFVIWDELETSGPVPEDPYDIIAAADGESRQRRRRKTAAFFTQTILPCLATAAACLVIGFFVWSYRRPVITTLASSPEAKASFTLPDGTSVCLNRGTTLTYKGNLLGRRREVSLSGEAYFDVAKDSLRPFVVSTEEMDIVVLGTRFTLSAYQDHPAAAYLEEGLILARASGFTDAYVLPGEQISPGSNPGVWVKRPVNVNAHTSWRSDRLRFVDTPLDEIITALEHWYNVSLCRPEGEEGVRLTMTVKSETIEETLRLIEELSSLEIKPL